MTFGLVRKTAIDSRRGRVHLPWSLRWILDFWRQLVDALALSAIFEKSGRGGRNGGYRRERLRPVRHIGAMTDGSLTREVGLLCAEYSSAAAPSSCSLQARHRIAR